MRILSLSLTLSLSCVNAEKEGGGGKGGRKSFSGEKKTDEEDAGALPGIREKKKVLVLDREI